MTGYTDIHEKKVKVKVTQSLFATPWNSPGQNPGVVSCSLLQGIFPTQGLNPGLPHCKQILYHLSHKGSPRTLDQVSYPFSRGSSRPRNRTGVSCIAGRFFTNWALRESHRYTYIPISKIKTRKEKKKGNSTELQKPNVEAEVYNNNKKCDWGGGNLKSLIRFRSANKIDNYSRGGKGGKNPKESTEQVKT